mmetsp:Transcript_31614/g.77508  ORF Transcript_31614/g.77508 Transcript_31614/m.77508 type:complete len:210 (+) Transcript_31614:323-952(+)
MLRSSRSCCCCSPTTMPMTRSRKLHEDDVLDEVWTARPSEPRGRRSQADEQAAWQAWGLACLTATAREGGGGVKKISSVWGFRGDKLMKMRPPRHERSGGRTLRVIRHGASQSSRGLGVGFGRTASAREAGEGDRKITWGLTRQQGDKNSPAITREAWEADRQGRPASRKQQGTQWRGRGNVRGQVSPVNELQASQDVDSFSKKSVWEC